MTEWVKTDEKLPPLWEPVIVYLEPYGQICQGVWEGKKFTPWALSNGKRASKNAIPYWAPFPEKPDGNNSVQVGP